MMKVALALVGLAVAMSGCSQEAPFDPTIGECDSVSLTVAPIITVTDQSTAQPICDATLSATRVLQPGELPVSGPDPTLASFPTSNGTGCEYRVVAKGADSTPVEDDYLRPGTYVVSVRKSGFQTITVSNAVWKTGIQCGSTETTEPTAQRIPVDLAPMTRMQERK